jgi:hypothetical protein
MVVVVGREYLFVDETQIERRQTPMLDLDVIGHLLRLLSYMVCAGYSYIYMPNSIIVLNTSDSIGIQRSPMHDSDGV